MKEEYATSENLVHKATEWLARSDGRPSRRDRLRFDPTSSALLVLDMQQYFTNSKSHAFVPTTRAILPNIKRLVGFFRETGRPVIYTRHALRDDEEPGTMSLMWQDVVREGTPESRIMSLLKPRPSEIVIRKTRYSAFVDTDLEKILRGSGTKSVVVTGVTTHLCCDTTSRDAFMRDFIVYFTVDGTASWTEDLHMSSLLILSDGVVVPVTTADICNDWRE